MSRLGIYELSYFITYSIIFLKYIELYKAYIWATLLLYPLYAWLSVIFYFFIKKLCRGQLSKVNWWHTVLPFVLLLTNIIIMPLVNYQSKYNVLVENQMPADATLTDSFFYRLNHTIYPLLLIIQAFVYVGLDFFEIAQLKKRIREEFSFEEGINLKWATKILVIFTSFFIVSIILFNDTFHFAYLLFIAIIIGIESVNYLHNYYHEFLKANEEVQNSEKQAEKYSHSALSGNEKKRLFAQVEQFMLKDKVYMNSDLRLSDIAVELRTNRQYISQVINEETGNNFYHFTNKYRIDEFVRLHQSGEFKNLSIEGIANKVGFKSKSSFYTAFKKEKGSSPRKFKEKNSHKATITA